MSKSVQRISKTCKKVPKKDAKAGGAAAFSSVSSAAITVVTCTSIAVEKQGYMRYLNTLAEALQLCLIFGFATLSDDP